MYYLKKCSFLVLPVLTLGLVFSCAKEDLSDKHDEKMCLTSSELKTQIQNDELTIAFREKIEEELSIFFTQDDIPSVKEIGLSELPFSESHRLEYFEAIQFKYPDLSAYAIEDQIEIIFDLDLGQNEVGGDSQLIILEKSNHCQEIYDGIQAALNAGYVFLAHEMFDGVDAMTDLAGDLINMYADFCLG